MVISKETNKSAFFFEKKAYLQLPRFDKISLAASSKYPGFHLTENWVDVETEITLTSDCSAKTKQEMIIDSMREQFKKRLTFPPLITLSIISLAPESLQAFESNVSSKLPGLV